MARFKDFGGVTEVCRNAGVETPLLILEGTAIEETPTLSNPKGWERMLPEMLPSRIHANAQLILQDGGIPSKSSGL